MCDLLSQQLCNTGPWFPSYRPFDVTLNPKESEPGLSGEDLSDVLLAFLLNYTCLKYQR